MSDIKRRDEIQGDIVHVYDGIEEADNNLPQWWLWLFYGSIVFAVGYWFYYQEFELGPSSLAEYRAEQEASAADAPVQEVTAADLIALSEDEGAVAEGRAVFTTNCQACHGDRAQGGIGPNLTDNAWIHGGDPTEIFQVVSNGAPGVATMPAWTPQLGQTTVTKVVAYVLSLRNTNVEGKEAQGEPWAGATADP